MMQLFNKSTGGQRFLAFIIDLFLVAVVIGIFSAIVLLLTGFDFEAYNKAQSEYLTDYILYMQYNTEEYYDSFRNALQEYYSYSVHFYLVLDLIALVVFVPYFIVLPHFWEKQTIGRMVVKVKVISHRGKIKPSIKQLIVREIAGTWLLYLVSSFFMSGFLVIISALFAAIGGRSIVDAISGTDLVQKDPFTVDPEAFKRKFVFNDPRNPESSQFNPDLEGFRRDDSIDAEVKDVSNNEDEYKKSNDDSYNNNDNNESKDNSDDEYQVF